MDRRTGVLLAVVLLALAAIAWLWGVGTDGAPSTGDETHRASERGPPRPAAAGAPGRPSASPDAPAPPAGSEPSSSRSSLDAELRYPSALPSHGIRLSLRTSFDDGPSFTWTRHDPRVAMLIPPTGVVAEVVLAEQQADHVRVTGLTPGRVAVVAEAHLSGEVVAAAAPVSVDLAEGENRTTVELVASSDFAVLSYRVVDGDAPVEGARIQIRLDDTYWPSVQTGVDGQAIAAVPGGATVRTWVDSFPGHDAVPAPREQSFRVTPRERRDVLFEVGPTTPVRVRAVGSDPVETAGGGISGFWRLERGVRPVYVGLVQRAGPDGERWYRLAPGRYGVLFGGSGPYAPTWHEFVVDGPEATTVRVPLARGGRRVRIRLRSPEDRPPTDDASPPKPIASVLLVRRGAIHPSDLAVAGVTLDEAGRGQSQALPDGEYELRVWALRVHRRVRVDAVNAELDLVLPARDPASPVGGLEGSAPGHVAGELRARTPGDEWTRSPDRVRADGYRFAALRAGPVEVVAEPTPFGADFVPYRATVLVKAGAVTTHDVVAAPR